MPPKKVPSYSPPPRKRRAVPGGAARRPDDIYVPRHTARERRAMENERRRAQRFGHRVSTEAMQRYLLPYQRAINELLDERDRDFVAFSRAGKTAVLHNKRVELENARQTFISRYLEPISNYRYFWEDQLSGGPPQPPPPPPPGMIR